MEEVHEDTESSNEDDKKSIELPVADSILSQLKHKSNQRDEALKKNYSLASILPSSKTPQNGFFSDK